MSHKPIRVKFAWGLAIFTSLLTIAIGPITQLFMSPTTAEPIYYIATYIMLASVVFLLVVLSNSQMQSGTTTTVKVESDRIVVAPCKSQEHLRWQQADLDAFLKFGSGSKQADDRSGILHHSHAENSSYTKSHWRKLVRGLNMCKVLELEALTVPEQIADLWRHLPSMKVLNVNGSSLPANFWASLEGCPELAHVLAHQVRDTASPKEIYMSVPEITVHRDNKYIGVQTAS